MNGRLESYIADTGRITDFSDLMGYFDEFVKGYGFETTVYMLIREALQSVELERGLIYHSFPADWAEHYIDQHYYAIDPCISIAPTEAEPYFWSKIGEMVSLTETQKAYMEDLARYGMVEGLSIPVFSAKGTIAYFAMASGESGLVLSPDEIAELQYIAHRTHVRYQELGGIDNPDMIILSPREKEVLYWIAQGKSNSVIASILDISDHTVDTLVRRCFQKLGVTSRVSAALRGVCAGLIAA